MTRTVYHIAASLVLLMTALIGFHAATSARALETHEIFVAQTSREMLANRDAVVPTFGGEIRLKKPPLMYWAVAGVAVVTGQADVPAWVARTPSVLAAMVLALSTMLLGRVLYDRQTALLAGGMLAFSTGVFLYSANARPEMLYAACTGVMTLGFAAAWHLHPHKHTRSMAALGWAALALALLAKGPQLPVLVLVGLSLWAIKTKGVKPWAAAFRPVMGLGIVVALIAPWLIAVLLRVDDAVAIWQHELIGLRFENNGETESTLAGLWAWLKAFVTPEYLLFCVSFMLPWGALLFMGLCVPWTRRRPGMPAGRPIWFALLVVLLGLSVPTHFRDYYLLPVLPILAVLIASGVIDFLDKSESRPLLRRISLGSLLLISAFAVALTVYAESGTGLSAFEWASIAVLLALLIAAAWFTAARCHASRLRVALFVTVGLWGALFFMAGDEPVLWRTRHQRNDTIASAAADLSNDPAGDLPVVAAGFDPDDLIYRVSRPIIAFPAEAPAQTLLSHAPMVLVAQPGAGESLRKAGAQVETVLIINLENDEWIEVSRVTTTAPDSP